MSVASAVLPFLLSVPLHFDGGTSAAILIIHQGQAYTAGEGLKQIRGFVTDGRGGFIAAAQTTGSKWGYINERGRWIVPPDLDDARAFASDGLARFQKDGRWGYINAAGEITIRPQFEEAKSFEQGLAVVKVGEAQYRFIDRTGKFAFDRTFIGAESFSAAGLAPVMDSGGKMRVGYIDRTGKWVIKPQFKSSLAFGSDGVAPASQDGRTFGLIDRKGKWVIQPKYADIREFNDDGLAYFSTKDSSKEVRGYLNAKGEVVLKGEARLSARMIAGVVSAGGASDGYLTKDGKALPGPRLSWAGPFNALGYAVVRTADFTWSEEQQRHLDSTAQWGILRRDGSFVAAPSPLLEPWTDAEGWIPGVLPNTPLTPFLTADRQVAFLDRDGGTPYRLRYENERVALLDVKGSVLWQSEPGQGKHAPAPF